MSSSLTSSPCNLHERGRVCCILLGHAVSKLAVVSEYARLNHAENNEAAGMEGVALLLDELTREFVTIQRDLRPFLENSHGN